MEIDKNITLEEYKEALKNKDLLENKLLELLNLQIEFKRDEQKLSEIYNLIKQTRKKIIRENIKIELYEKNKERGMNL